MYIVLVGTGFSTQCYGTFDTEAEAKDWAEETFSIDDWKVFLLRQP